MILDSSPSITTAPAPPKPSHPRPGAQSASGSSAAAYALVRDDVEGGQRKNQAAQPTASVPKKASLWQDGDYGFGDFIDVVNPLQHIPIVATIYRNLSGDQIGMAARVIGGALWGRIGGFVAGIINSAVEWFTGKDIGDHVYAAIRGQSDASAVAQAPAPKPRESAPGKIDATPPAAPLSGRDPLHDDRERHSALLPSPAVFNQIEQSYYHRDDDDESAGVRPRAIRLRA